MAKPDVPAHILNPPVTDRERQLATLMHAASVFTPLWLPFIVWAVASRSNVPFLTAHSRQAAFEGIYWKAFLLFLMVVSLGFTVARLVYHYNTQWQELTWQEGLFRVLISIIVFVALWVFNLVQSVLQARSAYKGVWPKRERKRFAKAFASPNV